MSYLIFVAIDIHKRGDLLLEPQVVVLGASEGGKSRHHWVVMQIESFERSKAIQHFEGRFGGRDLVRVQAQLFEAGTNVDV